MTTSNKLISLSGRKGSGKDTVFKELCKKFPQYTFKRLAWGDALKKEVHDIFGIPMDLLHADEETKNNTETQVNVGLFLEQAKEIVPWKKWFTAFGFSNGYLTVREVLQLWGTDVRRTQDPEYWVKKIVGRIDTHPNPSDILVITDTRFENELDAIHARNGLSIWIDRHSLKEQDTHESEKDISESCQYSVHGRGYCTPRETVLSISKLAGL
jgi:hypothetical protein